MHVPLWLRCRAMATAVPPPPPPNSHHSHSHVCAICQDTATGASVEIPCGHTFHRACLDAWAFRSATCPVCRAYLSPTPPTSDPPTPAGEGAPGGACRRCLLDVLWDGLDAACGLAGVLGAVCARALCAVLCFFAVVHAGKAVLALLLLGEPDHSLVDWSPAPLQTLRSSKTCEHAALE